MKARLQGHCLLSSSSVKARLSLLRPGVLWAGAGSHGAAQRVWLLCAGYSVLQTLLPRLDDVPVRTPRGEGQAQGPAAVCLYWDRMPRYEEGAPGPTPRRLGHTLPAQAQEDRASVGFAECRHCLHGDACPERPGQPIERLCGSSTCSCSCPACTDALGRKRAQRRPVRSTRLPEQSMSYMRVASARRAATA